MWNGSEDPKKEEAAALPWAVAVQKERIASDFKESPGKYCLPGEAFPSSPTLYKFIQTRKGHSIGRWEGDTLVVDTTGFNDKSWLDIRGFPVTDALHLTERMRRTDFGHLDVRITVNDPKAYTRPFDLTVSLQFQDTELIEYVCNENEKYVTQTPGK